MLKSTRTAILAALGGAAIAYAAPAAAQTETINKDQVIAILRENPEIVLEALRAAQTKEHANEVRAMSERAKPVAEKIIQGDSQVAFLGNPAGKPIVEFFDYNCGFCKRFHAETATPLLAEGKVKVLMVQTPILGEGSKRMAEFAAAANLQGKFQPAHMYLMQHGAKTVDDANALIAGLITAAGLDKAKFDKALADGSAKAQVTHNDELSRTAGVAGTPLIWANGAAIPGAIPLANLKLALGS